VGAANIDGWLLESEVASTHSMTVRPRRGALVVKELLRRCSMVDDYLGELWRSWGQQHRFEIAVNVVQVVHKPCALRTTEIPVGCHFTIVARICRFNC
jgi:hypothetical protein